MTGRAVRPDARVRAEPACRGLPAEAGFSLPEVMVAMTLLGLVLSLVLGLVTTFLPTFTREREAGTSTMVAAAGMNELTRVIRSGTGLQVAGAAGTSPVFVEAAATSMTLYAFIDTDSADPRPVKVRFAIDGQRRLVERRWQATTTDSPWAFETGTPADRTIARSIPTDAPALFTYLDENGAVIAVPSGGFTPAQLRGIAAVQVTLQVQADTTARADPVTLQNAVGIPNLGKSRIRP